MSRLIKPVFLLTGFGLFAWALRSADLSQVVHLIAELGFGFLAILLIYSFVTFVDTAAWKYNFKPSEAKGFTFWNLWRIRQIGESYNTITPFGTVGGEPVKAQLLKNLYHITFKEGLASTIVCRTTLLMGLILFLIPGTLLIYNSRFITPAFKHTCFTGLIVFTTLIILFFLFQITGCLTAIVTRVSRLPFATGLKDHLEHFEILDRNMGGYYRTHPALLFKSISLAFLGWLVGIADLYATFYFLGKTASLADIWIIESLIQLVRVASFFIPFSIGALEGGMVLIFVSMGFTADLGLTISLVRRAKEMLWVGLGLVFAAGMLTTPVLKPKVVEENSGS